MFALKRLCANLHHFYGHLSFGTGGLERPEAFNFTCLGFQFGKNKIVIERLQ